MLNVGIAGLDPTGLALRAALTDAGLRAVPFDPASRQGSATDLAGCNVVIVCGAVSTGSSGTHDIAGVWALVESMAPHLPHGAVVALTSTLAPGTCDALNQAFPDLELVSLPSFVVPDRAYETTRDPDRIVVGTTSAEAARTITEVMSKVAPGALLLVMPPLEAELVKLCSNALLAAKVGVANELADICAVFHTSWERIQAAVGLDRRIGRDHLGVTPERGFADDVALDLDGLVAASSSAGLTPAILQEIARFNRRSRSEARARRSADPVRST